jgi:hypothetical protein
MQQLGNHQVLCGAGLGVSVIAETSTQAAAAQDRGDPAGPPVGKTEVGLLLRQGSI